MMALLLYFNSFKFQVVVFKKKKLSRQTTSIYYNII